MSYIETVTVIFAKLKLPLKPELSRTSQRHCSTRLSPSNCLIKSNIDYAACSRLLHDCDVPLRKAISYLPHLAATEEHNTVVEEVHMLENSVSIHHCICEGLRNIALGDKALSKALMDEEDLNMDGVKDSLDYYRQASIATREKDMETEAIAMHRIGKVYIWRCS